MPSSSSSSNARRAAWRASSTPASPLSTKPGRPRKASNASPWSWPRGVIHRDLQPTNILVQDPESADSSGSLRSREPVVKILDSGLARITDVDGVEATMTSESARLMGTLAYMSPEQAGGDPDELDVRTDVYSLGVILYELLFGERPYETSQGSLVEALRVIREAAPARRGSYAPAFRAWTRIWRPSASRRSRRRSINATPARRRCRKTSHASRPPSRSWPAPRAPSISSRSGSGAGREASPSLPRSCSC
ncbi:MAG: protein kinase [Candidatus Eisenbacteria bacterium]|nr:protein kinase [Candidatus Eisenbacteria bacterium]